VAELLRRIALFGATSAIVQEAARRFAADGDRIHCVGRNAERLRIVAEDLRSRGATEVTTEAIDLDLIEEHAALIRRADAALGGIEIALVGHGALVDQETANEDFNPALAGIKTNFLSPASLSLELARILKPRRAGTIAVIGSVAGDRGRRKNFAYGAAKGGLDIWLGGLRNDSAAHNIAVVTIKPGFVDTPMTAHMKKGLLFASARAVGGGVYRAILAKKDIAYVPWFWRWIMFVVRAIPEGVFKNLNI
jgi:short-subunit dehydrogenase